MVRVRRWRGSIFCVSDKLKVSEEEYFGFVDGWFLVFC